LWDERFKGEQNPAIGLQWVAVALEKKKVPLKDSCALDVQSGELAEWSNAAVLKTVVLQGTVGSNPTLSAK
jgi:hypothetical protein